MRVLISGATGLIGRELTRRLKNRGSEVVALTRNPGRVEGPAIGWSPSESQLSVSDLEGFDAVIHLAGESIAAGRWTESQKRRIRDSRVKGTSLLADALSQMSQPPSTLISASAIGIYGDRGDEKLDEDSESGRTFLAEVCIDWEAAAEPARQKGLRVVHPRIGVVLTPEGGALKAMLLPFKFGLGGRVGSGQQYLPWISLEDVVGLLIHTLDRTDITGPINLTSPEPVTNADFTRAMGAALKRPTLLPAPGFALKLVMGEMADELLLSSARVLPKRALETGYDFTHMKLQQYLEAQFGAASE